MGADARRQVVIHAGWNNRAGQAPGKELDVVAENTPNDDYSPDMPADVPKSVGNYLIVEKIGEGGMGAVYKAKHVKLGSFAAIKFLTPSLAKKETFVKRFEREARLAAHLASPYSVRTFDIGEIEDTRFILMEYVEGENLASILERRGRLKEKEALGIVYDVCQALQEAHDMGIVHRDIKPENILLTKRGVPKLADLGIAKDITSDEHHLTLTGFAIGTPSFMSPEQAQGLLDVDVRSDIYSLGATFYRMVVGDLPFRGETPLSVMHKIATESVPDPLSIRPDLSSEVGSIICKMMARKREQRCQTVGEVMRHIEAVRSGERTGLKYVETSGLLSADGLVTKPSAGRQAARRRRKKAIFIAGGAAAVVMAAVLAIVLATRDKPVSPPVPRTPPPDNAGPIVPDNEQSEVPTPPVELSDAERAAQESADAAAEELRKAADAEALARQRADAQAGAQAEADRIARQRAADAQAARDESERREAARRKAKADRIAQERAASAEAAREEADRLAREKAEAEKAVRLAKAEVERLAREKTETERRLGASLATEVRDSLSAVAKGDWTSAIASTDRAIVIGKNRPPHETLRKAITSARETAAAKSRIAHFSYDAPPARETYGAAVASHETAAETLAGLDPEAFGVEEAAAARELFEKARRTYDAAERQAFEAAYPELTVPIDGENVVPGLLAMHRARADHPKYPGLDAVAEMNNLTADHMTVGASLAASKPKPEDYETTESAHRVAASLHDAVAICDRLARGEKPDGRIDGIRAFLFGREASAHIAAGEPGGALADVCRMTAFGGTDELGLRERAIADFVALLGNTLRADPAAAVKVIEEAGAECGGEEFADARNLLTNALVVSPCMSALMKDRALVEAWGKNIGSIAREGMVWAPGGRFMLGEDYQGLVSLTPSSAPQHAVELSAFYVAMHETTNEEFQAFVDAGGYETDEYWPPDADCAAFLDRTGKPGPRDWENGRFPPGEGKHPVVGVSWYEAAAYAAWAGKRLPTEAQWECAALAFPSNDGKRLAQSAYPWGNDPPREGEANLGDVTKATGAARPVGSFAKDKSRLGCFDMLGNVREWTCSSYDPYPNSGCKDGKFGRGCVVVRGASYHDAALTVKPTGRRGREKSTRDPYTGFRCVWMPPRTP